MIIICTKKTDLCTYALPGSPLWRLDYVPAQSYLQAATVNDEVNNNRNSKKYDWTCSVLRMISTPPDELCIIVLRSFPDSVVTVKKEHTDKN